MLIRIMVVDDEPGLAEAIACLLRLDGHEVTSATSSERALEQLTYCGQVHLLISDLIMPGLSGVELHEQLRRRGLAPFRFVLMTGSALSVVRRVSNDLHGLVLRKPVAWDTLRAVATDCANALERQGHKAG